MVFTKKTLAEIKLLFAQTIANYLSREIAEREFGSFCFDLIIDEKVKTLLSRDIKLRGYILDCVDITWLSESSSFDEFKKELRKYSNEVLEKEDG
jgi:hypothetical protein